MDYIVTATLQTCPFHFTIGIGRLSISVYTDYFLIAASQPTSWMCLFNQSFVDGYLSVSIKIYF